MTPIKEDTVNVEEISLVGEETGRISHDMNQPLNSIKMISGGILYLLKQGKKLPDEELAECMKEISCQADRIVGIMKQLDN